MISLYSVLYALLLLAQLSSLSVAAMPSTKAEDNVTEQDGLGLLLRDELMAERAGVSPLYRRSVLDDVKDEDGGPKIIFVSGTKLRGHSLRGPNPMFTRSASEQSDAPAEGNFQIERRTNDIDILRCMVGRVYRPCWEV